MIAHLSVDMTAQKQREIVIEFEKVQMIRKSAKTALALCNKYGRLQRTLSGRTMIDIMAT